jgi:dolichol-phosphate mannosyltransferase
LDLNKLDATADASLASAGLNQEERLLVLVCTYNEKLNLPSLFDKLDAILPGSDILVVDDNSPDGTAEWVREKSKTRPHTFLIHRSGKLGLGTAIRAGMRHAIENHYDWVLNLDADLSHDPAAIPKLLAQRPTHDLVIGSRYVAGGGLEGCSWKRIFVSRCANAYARWVVGWKVRDCSSAYRLYRVAALARLDWTSIHGKGYGFLEEILWHLIDQGNRWTEVGIVYTERQQGDSKISIKEALSTIDSLHRVARLRSTKSKASSE